MFKVDDEYGFLTKELIEKEYIENGLSDKKIADKYHIGSKATVWKRRRHYGIANKTPNKSNTNASVNRKFFVSKDDAIKWKFEGKTYEEMADIVGCSRMVLYRRIKELGLTEECDQAMNKLRWYEELSSKQIRFLLGDLLGDGSVTHWGMYQCNHSYKQKRFMEYKLEILNNILSPNFELKETSVDNRQNGKSYRKYYLRTMGNKSIKNLYSNFYKNGVKTFPIEYLKKSKFDELSLAAWYMGDGGRKGNVPSLYTYGFGFNGNLEILKFVFGCFGIKGEMKENGRETRSEDKCNFISFTGEDAKKFFSLVSPYMLPSFSYKLPEEYKANIGNNM